MNLEELRAKHKDDILRITGEYGITNVRVFLSPFALENKTRINLSSTFPQPFNLLELNNIICLLENSIGFPVDLFPDQGLSSDVTSKITEESEPL